jgi:hypothetical protein
VEREEIQDGYDGGRAVFLVEHIFNDVFDHSRDKTLHLYDALGDFAAPMSAIVWREDARRQMSLGLRSKRQAYTEVGREIRYWY